jgi:hypothetical protein
MLNNRVDLVEVVEHEKDVWLAESRFELPLAHD